MSPKRLQRSRRKGYTTPANTIYVGRPTGFGNPFKVGVDGTTEECVDMYKFLLSGFLCATSKATIKEQKQAHAFVKNNINKLKGKNLSCWCSLKKPCHADVLLKLANK